MEPIYEATGRMTKERYRRFFEIHSRVTKQTTVYAVCAVVCLIVGIFLWFPADTFLRVMSFIMLVFAVFFFLYPRIAGEQYASAMEKTGKGQMNLPFTLRFFENELAEFTPKGELHLRYDEIYRVVETRDAIVIYLNGAQAFTLFRTELTRGEAARLISFLRFQKQVAYKFV